MPRELDISKMSNENIEDIFSQAFEEQVASPNNISEFECICIRENSDSTNAKIEVTVSGMAGNPTADDFKNGKMRDYDSVIVEDNEKGLLKFVYSPDDTINLNTNDFMVVYKTSQ